MLNKQSIVAALGEQGLALPQLVNEALAANDRLKYRLTLLQLAARHAEAPDALLPDLRDERLAAQMDMVSLDDMPAQCRRLASGKYELPVLPRVLSAMVADMRQMLAPIIASGELAQGGPLAVRAESLLPPLLRYGTEFAAADLDGWSHAERERGDSLHLLIMDAHRELNRVQQSIATEIVDGASVYGLTGDDPRHVRAFMRGVNRTARLKFDHPGLATTATHSRERLVIQNDIGTTDAHVLVIHVDADGAAVTYTDVHLRRLLFFQALFARYAIKWQDTRVVQDARMTDGLYHMTIGRYAAVDAASLDTFLEFLGSRIVFLIDWNRARKQLRLLVGKQESVRLLEWAAEHEVGHMGLLRVGGAHAVFDAMDFAAHGRGHFGQTLDNLLGPDRASRYLEYALRTAALELLADRSETLVHDELRAEMMRHLRSSSESVLDLVCEHAGLIVEIASAVRDALAGLGRGDGQAQSEALAARCKAWESDADRLVNDVREAARTATETSYLQELVQHADDVADDLEEMAFYATLLRRAEVPVTLLAELAALAGRLVAGSQELVKALETVRGLGPRLSREDLKDFLEAIHRVSRVEHETDELKRRIDVQLASGPIGARALYLAAGSAQGLELAGDHLQHVAMLLRDRLLARLATS